MTELTAPLFDALVRDGRKPAPKIIWTLKAIGQRIGRGEDFARSLVDEPGSPVRRQGRQYFAFEDELIAFLARS